MLDLRFKEKIQALKARFIDGDDVAKKQIAEWEREIQNLSLISDFVEQPIVQNIVNVLRDRLKAVLLEKATKGTTDVLDAREKEIRYALQLFMPKYQSVLETLETIIDNELL